MMTTNNKEEVASRTSVQPNNKTQPVLRAPNLDDAKAVHALITASPPLDVNSVYVYLLLSHHFTDTCVVAELDNEIVGFVSAYVPPKTPDVLFVWQVAVHERGRGFGLGKSMLQEILQRPGLQNIRFVETTVGPDNAASRGMFASLARKAGTEINETALFEGHHFGEQAHEDERLLRIGPFTEK
ncbi:diaminobutyrate acetyltransferase [Neopusillimonas maritima]|uniref:L-2,4-diaminobutyric acid acetyltransferase n=2 Tax=Neopusillimonas maritima TaxID=2026239 RepID=A0A3A1YWY2_9BURK|nr:diaminobutyrate acetyltransferase [Neopusillimonas maritima]RIY40567.1 diaminobutyrate acetyltransferase [Neopusillimonas maritima]